MPSASSAVVLSATLLATSVALSGCLLFASVDDGGSAEPGITANEPGVGPEFREPEPAPPSDGGEPAVQEPDAGGAEPEPDAGAIEPDVGPLDAGSLDAGVDDAGADAGFFDGGPLDAGVLDAGPTRLTFAECQDLIGNGSGALHPSCEAFVGVFSSSPQLLTSRVGVSRLLRLHGRFVVGDAVTVATEGTDVFSVNTVVGGTGQFIDIPVPEGVTHIGRLHVQGSTYDYGRVWVNIRAHELSFFQQRELPQTTNGNRLGALTPDGTNVPGIQPFLTTTGKVCGAGSLKSVACAYTDVDGAVRESQTQLGDALLENPRIGVAIVSAAGRIFAVGGREGETDTAVVVSARVDSEGHLRDVRTEQRLSVPRAFASAVVVGGELCVLGGRDGATVHTSVECAPIGDDGLEPFSLAGNLEAPRFDAHAAVVGDRLLVVGGFSSDGSFASPNAESAATTSIPFVFDQIADLANSNRAAAAAYTVNDSFFLAGGDLGDGTYGTAVVEVKVNADGLPFQANFVTGFLPERTAGAKAVVTGNYIYVTSGIDEDGDPTAPLVVTLVASPALDTLLTVENDADTFDRAFGAGVLAGDSLFVVGGLLSDSTLSRNVIRAELNSSGQITRVSEQANMLPSGRSHSCAIVLEDRVFVIGGRGPTDTRPTSALTATLAADGSLSAFTEIQNVLPVGREGPRCHVLGDTLFVLGGLPVQAETNFSILVAPAGQLLTAAPANATTIFSTADGNFALSPRWMHTSRVFDADKLRVFAGIPASGNNVDLNTFDLLQIGPGGANLSNESNVTYDPPLQESASVLPLSDSEVIIGGGYNPVDTYRSGHIVFGNFADGDTVNVLSTARRGHVSALVGPTIVTLTGRGTNGNATLPQEATTIVGPLQ